jgi:hypothetical protein
MPEEDRLVGTQPFAVHHPPHLWYFLSTFRGSEGTGKVRPFTCHSYHIPTIIKKEKKRKEKKVKNKKIFCTEIYFYYTKFVQYQKGKKKGCKFFSLL